jgi:hypothetical protein
VTERGAAGLYGFPDEKIVFLKKLPADATKKDTAIISAIM